MGRVRSPQRSAVEDHPGERSPLLPKKAILQQSEEHHSDDVPYKNTNAKQFYALFICILMAYTLAYFDSTFMASSHPVITSYFNASHVASWLSTTFYLCNTISQPLYGRFSDIFGRRSVLLAAMIIFAAGTLWCALAPSIGHLIAARAVAGLGTGGITALSSILMADTIRIEHRGMFQGYLNMAFGVGTGLGAALGGVLCEKLGWRAAFGLQMPFVATFTILAYIAVPQNLGPCYALTEGKNALEALKSFDAAGAIALTFTVTGLVLGINLGGNVFAWSHPIILASLSIFVLALLLLVRLEKRAASPVLPPSLLSGAPWANLMWSNSLSGFLIQAVLFNVPLLLQAVRMLSPPTSGLYMLVPLVGLTIASVFAGLFIKRTGLMKLPSAIGAILLLLGVLPLGFLHNSKLPQWAILLLIPWAHVGHGFLSTTTSVAVLAVCEPDEQAVVTTTLGLARMLGAVVGIAVSSWSVQNFLILYLSRIITGDEDVKQQIISRIRKSVAAILELDPVHKAEAREAYALALRNTFLCFLVAGFIICCLILPLQYPRLTVSKQLQSESVSDDESVSRETRDS